MIGGGGGRADEEEGDEGGLDENSLSAAVLSYGSRMLVPCTDLGAA